MLHHAWTCLAHLQRLFRGKTPNVENPENSEISEQFRAFTSSAPAIRGSERAMKLDETGEFESRIRKIQNTTYVSRLCMLILSLSDHVISCCGIWMRWKTWLQNLVSQRCQVDCSGRMVEYSHIFPLAYDGKKCPISNTERQEGEGIGRLLHVAITMHPKMKSALVRAASYDLPVYWLIQ